MNSQEQLSNQDKVTTTIKTPHKHQFIAKEPAKNRHYLILGKSGEGKTVLTKCLLQQISTDKSAHFHVIDLHGEYSDIFSPECVWPAHEHGFPFNWLENTSALPWDFHIDQKIDELKEAAPQLGSVQLGELRSLLVRCKKPLTNKQLELLLRKHLSQSTQFQLEPLLLLLRANTNLKSPYSLNLLHDLSRVSNKVSQSIYAIALFRHLFNQAKHKKAASDHYLIFEEGARLRKAETTIDMLYQEGRKFGMNGVFIAQSWKSVPLSVKQNSGTMLLFPSAAAAFTKSSHELSTENFRRPLYKFNGSDGNWLEAHQERKCEAAFICNQLPVKTKVLNKARNVTRSQSELVKADNTTSVISPTIEDEVKQTSYRTQVVDTLDSGPVASNTKEESVKVYERTKWIALFISSIGCFMCLFTILK